MMEQPIVCPHCHADDAVEFVRHTETCEQGPCYTTEFDCGGCGASFVVSLWAMGGSSRWWFDGPTLQRCDGPECCVCGPDQDVLTRFDPFTDTGEPFGHRE
jgi:hypothetical protein